MSQVEHHRLLADLLLAHQAALHGGGDPPVGAGLPCPAPVAAPGPVTARHVLHVVRIGAHSHHGVVKLEHLPVSDAVVDGEIVSDFGFVRTSLYWTLEW